MYEFENSVRAHDPHILSPVSILPSTRKPQSKSSGPYLTVFGAFPTVMTTPHGSEFAEALRGPPVLLCQNHLGYRISRKLIAS